VSAFTAVEADYLILTRLGIEPELAFIDDLAHAFSVQSLDRAGLLRTREVCERYRDLELGLADASMIVIANARSTHAIATFDHRHFRAVTAIDGKPFRLLPTDT
jgi:predicted nucleic acid-binding protein